MTAESPSWRPLKVGAILKPGSVIQTAADTHVDLVLNNPNASEVAVSQVPSGGGAPLMNASHAIHPKVEQDAVRIFENTVLGVDKLTINQTGADKVTETQLDLKFGRIFGTVKKLSNGSKYEIKIPNGVAGIRGTIYFISADGEVSVLSSLQDLANNVPSGSLVLAYFGPDGNVITQVVGDGKHFDSRTGQLTSIPDSTLNDMVNWARSLGVAAGGIFVEFAMDRTVYILSPSTAAGGSGQGQGGGGGIEMLGRSHAAP